MIVTFNKLKTFLLMAMIMFLASCSNMQQTSTKNTSIEKPKKSEITSYKIPEDTSKYQTSPVLVDEEIEKNEIAEVKATEIKQNEYTNLWDKIPSLYQITEENNKRISLQKKYYSRNPKYLYRVSERAQPYLYLIVNQIEQRQMPGELALLPIVESAFQTYAYSHGRASGIWQFIPGTAKQYGLKQSWWYDGRRDVYAATNAALDYLEVLSKKYDGDWLLALAAYNSGAGTVNRAIRKNKKQGKPTTFWDLSLPKETRAYVPKLLALAQIIKELPENKISLLVIKNEPYLDVVDCQGHIDLAVAAGLAEISIDNLYQYNPGFNQWATDPKGPHNILIPIEKVEIFEKNLAELNENDRLRWTRHQIKAGETLSTIARKYHITIATLKQANRLKNSRIRAGKFLTIPIASKTQGHYSQTTEARRNKIIKAINAKRKTVYVVKRGDSFWTISRKFHMNYRKLAKLNNMSPLDTLSIGQKLLVRSDMKDASLAQSNPKSRKVKSKKLTYKVRKGDSLYEISRKFRVRVNDLLKWNRIGKNNYLQPGQKLTLYVDV